MYNGKLSAFTWKLIGHVKRMIIPCIEHQCLDKNFRFAKKSFCALASVIFSRIKFYVLIYYPLRTYATKYFPY